MTALLGLIFVALLVRVCSKRGLLQPDDRASVRIEVESQRLDENMTSLKDTHSQLLATLLQNQSAMMTSQAEIIRTLADVKRTLSERCNVDVTTSDVTATASSVVPDITSTAIPATSSSVITADCFTDCLDYRTRGGADTTSCIITTLSQDGLCNKQTYCDMATDGGGWTVFQRHQSDAMSFNRIAGSTTRTASEI